MEIIFTFILVSATYNNSITRLPYLRVLTRWEKTMDCG